MKTRNSQKNAERDWVSGKTYIANFSLTAAIKTFHSRNLGNFRVRVRLMVSYGVRVRDYFFIDVFPLT